MLIFENSGEIDPRSITTFGVSSKETDDAIGYFGTGLKYAIAILLREGCEITIWSGLNKLEFGVEKSKLRVDEFNFITMNGNPISFTTELGKNWELWQAYREIFCNCKDEHGIIYHSSNNNLPDPEEGKTLVVVRGSAFEVIFQESSKYILDNGKIASPQETNYAYYKDVRVFDSEKIFINTYNIQEGISLTEDRTAKSEWELKCRIGQLVSKSKDREIIRRAVCAPQGYYEHNVDFSWSNVSDEFIETVRELHKDKKNVINKTALQAANIKPLSDLPEVSDELDSLDNKKLTKAIDFCKKLGYYVDNYPVIVTDKLHPQMMGLAKDNKIYISHRNFNEGTKYLASTLIEEYLHNQYGFVDETYEFQTHLLNSIVSLGEKLTGEPL